MIFGIKEKIYNFDAYNVLLAIGKNIQVPLNKLECRGKVHLFQ